MQVSDMKKNKRDVKEQAQKDKFFCVMLFFQGWELNSFHEGTEEHHYDENKWYNVNNVRFDNHLQALDYYANTPCPASQLISSPTEEGLKKGMEEMKKNFQDENWLKEFLYPYL